MSSSSLVDLTPAPIGSIIKSDLDERDYRGLVLDNDMKVILISDSTSDKSAASLVLGVGYMDDPPEIQGLAHLCQHMIQDDNFTMMVTQYGGEFNASTSLDMTTFYFDVLPQHLDECLEEFAKCIQSPRFEETDVKSEIISINNEHELEYFNDDRRFFNLVKMTANKDHPFCTFGTGDKITLDIIPKRERINVIMVLKKFYSKWYSSNIMSLCVLGSEDLDTLEEMVQRAFSEVENSYAIATRWTDHPYGPQQLGLTCYIIPIIPTRVLEIKFPIPDFDIDYKSNPGVYLKTIIENQLSGSLIQFFRADDLCNNITVTSKSIARGFGFFTITLGLSKKGLENVDYIMSMVFQYICMIKTKGITKNIFEKVRLLQEEEFIYKKETSPIHYVQEISVNLQFYPLEESLSGRYFLDWRPDKIEELLQYLHPGNVRLFITANELAEKTDSTDVHFGTTYGLKPLSEESIDCWKQNDQSQDFLLPARILCLKQLHLLPIQEDDLGYPIIVKSTDLMDVWYKQDIEPILPKVYVILGFTLNYDEVESYMFTLCSIYVKLMRCKLQKFKMHPGMMVMDCILKATRTGMILEVSGYNHRIISFLMLVIHTLEDNEIDPEAFSALESTEVDASIVDPHVLVEFYLDSLLTEKGIPYPGKEKFTYKPSFEEFELFTQNIFKRMHIKVYVHGYATSQLAMEVGILLETHLISPMKSVRIEPCHSIKEWKLPKNSSYLLQVPVRTLRNSALGVYYQCPEENTRANVLVQLLAYVIKQPLCMTVRSKEKLGYYVKCNAIDYGKSCGLKIIVQTDKSPNVVDGRIERFLEKMKQYINNFTDNELENYKQAVIGRKSVRFRSLHKSALWYWKELMKRQTDFNKRNYKIAELQEVKKSELVKFYDSLVSHTSLHRRKLAVYISSEDADASVTPLYDRRFKTPEILENIEEFKRKRPFFEETVFGNEILPVYENIEEDS